MNKEDKEISEILKKELINGGIKFYFNTGLVKFSNKKELIVERNGKKEKIKFDKVLISVGRVLNIENLGLENGGVKLDNNGRKLIVDNYLRTTNKKILVCGDVAGSYQFTHAAELHAGVILNNFFSPFKKKLNNDYLSWVTYTSPEIATWGLNEKEIIKRNRKYEKLSLDFKDDDRAIVDDYTSGKMILYISDKKIIGGSMIAKNAGELFQELSLAMSSKMNIKNIFNKVYPYPTATRINKSIITKYFSRKLTERSKKILRGLYR